MAFNLPSTRRGQRRAGAMCAWAVAWRPCGSTCARDLSTSCTWPCGRCCSAPARISSPASTCAPWATNAPGPSSVNARPTCFCASALEGNRLKTIGLIGGMSWESTVPYYSQINQTVKQRLGGLHSARLVLYSVDFHDVERLQHAGDWDAAGAIMADAARSLQAAGADFLVLCTNTMHKVASSIESAV